MTNKELQVKAIKMAKSLKQSDHRGYEYLDRTIYYVKEKIDASGKVLTDKNGEPLIEILTYATAGRWITPEMMETAINLEKEFIDLNKEMRADMEKDTERFKWRVPKSEQKALSIDGIT